jgi:hypothetical protein
MFGGGRKIAVNSCEVEFAKFDESERTESVSEPINALYSYCTSSDLDPFSGIRKR